MTKTIEMWSKVEEALDTAKGIAFDGCHKIYVLLDHAQVDLMLGYGYGVDGDGSRLIHAIGSDADEMLATLKEWFEDSCALKFVEAVESVREGQDPNLGFTSLIPQGFDEEIEESDTEWCVSCEYHEADSDGLCESCLEAQEEAEQQDEEI